MVVVGPAEVTRQVVSSQIQGSIMTQERRRRPRVLSCCNCLNKSPAGPLSPVEESMPENPDTGSTNTTSPAHSGTPFLLLCSLSLSTFLLIRDGLTPNVRALVGSPKRLPRPRVKRPSREDAPSPQVRALVGSPKWFWKPRFKRSYREPEGVGSSQEN
ncbi:uncharacterized protein LOC135212239 [Macrobrachium nipponense]|uniref:uncharacterized protein LOC135212239 n=1 Tax=Macrobrachium nipponense TaxID=159736 RepID=UPI0030C86BAF